MKIDKRGNQIFTKRELLEKLNFTEEQADIVMQYQKKLPILLGEYEGFSINARELWTELGKPQGQFNKWAKRKIKDKGFENFKDYIEYKKDIEGGGRPSSEYNLNIKTTKTICLNENKNPKAVDIYQYLQLMSQDDTSLIIREQPRLEYQFEEMLRRYYEPFGVLIETQVPVINNKYRIDFVIDGSIAVEYDEEQHEYQIDEDRKRMREIDNWIEDNFCSREDWHLKWIRVKEGEEIEGMVEITKALIWYENEYMINSTMSFNDWLNEFNNQNILMQL